VGGEAHPAQNLGREIGDAGETEANSSLQNGKLIGGHGIGIEMHNVIANLPNIVQQFREPLVVVY
jgi:hypothetical protein